MLEDIILWNKREHIVFRLWAKDPTIFGQQQPLMLDWLSEPREMLGMLDSMSEMATKVKEHNFRSIVLLGMGGSSLAVKVFQDILAPEHNFFVLDTIHPAAIKRLEHELDLSSTLFIVASKSGSTLEPNLLYRYFLKKLMEQNVAQPFNHFLAITDPGTSLADEAYKNGFLTGPKGNPLIGGRYSALSPFGLFPAMLMGIDTQKLLENAIHMTEECGPTILPERNSGALLGLFLGVNARLGNDQLVMHFSPSLKPLGMWLEQLIAESLGKDQSGIVPIIDGGLDLIGLPHSMHCVVELADEPLAPQLLEALQNNQAKRIYVKVPDILAIGGEMFRWQIAVSSAATVLKLNPFDQPDVEKSKKRAMKILEEMKENKFLGPDNPCYSSAALDIFAPGSDKETINILASFFSTIKNEDYCAVLSYLDETKKNNVFLQSLVTQIRQRSVSILLQSGPRYLHSTGQLFKGGKNNGHFIMITGPYEEEIMSDLGLSFKNIHLSQALGDFQAMRDQGRHILHIHLKDIAVGFRELLALSKHM